MKYMLDTNISRELTNAQHPNVQAWLTTVNDNGLSSMPASQRRTVSSLSMRLMPSSSGRTPSARHGAAMLRMDAW